MITRTEIAKRTDRETFKIPTHNPPNYQISYFELSIVFVSNISVSTQKTLICNTALSIRASPRTINVKADPRRNPMMSKEPKRQTN